MVFRARSKSRGPSLPAQPADLANCVSRILFMATVISWAGALARFGRASELHSLRSSLSFLAGSLLLNDSASGNGYFLWVIASHLDATVKDSPRRYRQDRRMNVA